MIQNLTKLYEGGNLSGATAGVIYIPILSARTLKAVKVKTDEAVPGNAVFTLKKNGVAIAGADAITISTGNKIGSVSGLNVALAEGDELTLDMVSGSASAPLTLDVATEAVSVVSQADIYEAVKDVVQQSGSVSVTADDGAKTLTVAASGGSGGAGFFYHLDAKPQTYVSPWSDYFDDETKSLARWTSFQGAHHEFFIDNGQGTFLVPPTSTKFSGLIQALPVGDCTIVGKFIHPFPEVSTTIFGLALFQDAVLNPNTSDILLLNVRDDSAANFAVISDIFTSYTTYGSTPITAAGGLSTATYANGIYFRMSRSGTTWTFQYGVDGVNWTAFGTIAQGSFFTPKEFGVVVLNNHTAASPPVAHRFKCEFVYVIDQASQAIPGGPVGLSGTTDPTRRMICVGDSLTAGEGVSAVSSYPHQLAKLLPGSAVAVDGKITKSQGAGSWQTVIKAKAGYTLQNVIDNLQANVIRHRNTNLTRDIVVVWAGTGDLATLGDSGATSYARLVSLVTALKAAGFEVWVCTIIDRNAFTVAGFDTRRADFNTLVLANTAGADQVVNLWGDARLQDSSNATYFQTDTVHLNAAGMGVVAEIIEALL